ncbi:MAG: molybdopterin synthase sulfur carrier subunit [Pseudomonadota bacterium]|jgi:sulfur-carrier protein
MINLKYFASLKEELGVTHEAIALPAASANVLSVVQTLQARGGKWQDHLVSDGKLKFAVNHVMVNVDAPVRDGDEVAFFPPVTGG